MRTTHWLVIALTTLAIVLVTPTQGAQPTTKSASQIFAEHRSSVVQVFARSASSSSTGTGFYVSQDGLILTNYHVVEGCDDVTVSAEAETTRRPVRVIGEIPEKDLALLQDTSRSLHTFVEFGPEPGIGEDVTVLGHPKGLQLSVSKGIVSSLASMGEIRSRVGAPDGIAAQVRMLQVDSSSAPGNSGGPIFDQEGKCVAVLTLNFKDRTFAFGVMASEIDLTALKNRGRAPAASPPLTTAPSTPASPSPTLPPRVFPPLNELRYQDISDWTPLRRVTPDEVKRLVVSIRSIAKCQICQGKGYSSVRRVTGRVAPGSGGRTETNSTSRCSACEGTGESSNTEAAIGAIRRASEFSARLDMILKGSEESLNDLVVAAARMLKEVSIQNETDNSSEVLSKRQIGKTAVFGGTFQGERRVGGERVLAFTSARQGWTVFVVGVRAVDTASTDCIVAGVVVKALDLPSGTKAVLLKGGFVLP